MARQIDELEVQANLLAMTVTLPNLRRPTKRTIKAEKERKKQLSKEATVESRASSSKKYAKICKKLCKIGKICNLEIRMQNIHHCAPLLQVC